MLKAQHLHHPADPLPDRMAYKCCCPCLQAKAESAASCAAAAAGMLHGIGATAGKAQYWRSYYGQAVPFMITVLALIIPRQPQLASKARPSPVSSSAGRLCSYMCTPCMRGLSIFKLCSVFAEHTVLPGTSAQLSPVCCNARSTTALQVH